MGRENRKLTGKRGSAEIGGITLPVVNWSLNPTNAVQDVTNGESEGANEWEEGIDGGDGTVALVWDATIDPHATAGANLIPGKKGTLNLHLELAAAKPYVVPMIITSAPVSCAITGRVELSFNFNINGQITRPTGPIDTVTPAMPEDADAMEDDLNISPVVPPVSHAPAASSMLS